MREVFESGLHITSLILRMAAFTLSDAHAEEMEVLTAIYPDEFEYISDGDRPVFKLHLKPSDDAYIEIYMLSELPDSYPDEEPPIISIKIKKGLSAIHADELKVIADAIASENIGMPSIFSIAEALKEWLIDNNVAGQDGSMYSGEVFDDILYHTII